MEFVKRRNRLLTILIILAGVAWAVYWAYTPTLVDTRFVTGWTLLGLILVLMLLNAKKKLPFLPMGNTSTWLQFHIYGGTFAGLLFLVHIGFRIPNGMLDGILATVLVIVLLSGFIGLFLTRWLPSQLATRGSPIIFQRIPAAMRAVASDVEALVLESVTDCNSKAIPHYYVNRLKPFFAGPKNGFFHLLGVDRPRRILVSGINELRRFASPEEREILSKISEKVIQKNSLDYQHALQLALKVWLFFHIPLSYSLILIAALHTYLAYYFRGDLP